LNLTKHKWLLLSIYIPTVMFSFGQGLLVPILPLYAAEYGGSYSLAGLVVAAGWIGTMIGDVPVGMLLRKIGFRNAMIIGALLFGVATIALGFAGTPIELVALRIVAGIGIAFYQISRHTFITHQIPPETRGRAIAVFGGINRMGHFIGPLVGGFVASFYGLAAAIMVAGFVSLGIVVLAILLVREPNTADSDSKKNALDFGVLKEVVQHNPKELAAGGIAQIFAQMIRAGRQIVIPLYAAYAIGLDPAQVGQVVSASHFVEMFLFIPAGIIMDRWGRKAAAVPSFAIMGGAMLMVPFTDSYLSLMLVASLIGIGQGIGSGTMMTLGADLAPPGKTGEFLGIWRLIGDSGHAVAPMAIGAIADIIGLYLTAGIVGGIGFMSAGTIGAFVRETRWDSEEEGPAAAGSEEISDADSPGPSQSSSRSPQREFRD
jgi:MFS family permease